MSLMVDVWFMNTNYVLIYILSQSNEIKMTTPLFQSSSMHHPSNTSNDNPKMMNDNPVVSTHHFEISHSAVDKVNIHGGATNPSTAIQDGGPSSINQVAPVGSLYLNTSIQNDQQGMHTLYTNKGDAGWQAVSEKMVYSVKNYGAIGNGIADDTAAIQRALNACQNSQTPYTMSRLVFPNGTYRITSALKVDIRGNFVIEGSRESMIKVDNDDCTAFVISKDHVTITRMIFWNRVVGTYTSGNSIVFKNSFCIIQNCRFHGVYAVVDSIGALTIVDQCYITGILGNYIIWFHHNGWDGRITNNQIDQASYSSVTAVRISDSARGTIVAFNRFWGFLEAVVINDGIMNNVKDNVFYESKVCIAIKGGAGGCITGNTCQNIYEGGVRITPITTAYGYIVCNNFFLACTTYGVKIDPVSAGANLYDITISNNIVRFSSDTPIAGIHIGTNIGRVTIVGNRLVNYRAVGAGIILETGVTKCIMTSNSIEGFNPATKTIENDTGVNMLKTNNLII